MDATPPPHVGSFDIDVATAPPVLAQTRSLPGRPSPRSLPGRAYAPPASYPAFAVPEPAAPVPEAPQLSQPPTIDFSDSVRTLVPPAKNWGPPRWLTVSLLVAAVVGGAILGNMATSDQVARVIAAASQPRKKRTPPAAPPEAPPREAPMPSAAAPAEAPAPDEGAPPAPTRAANPRAASAARGHAHGPAARGKAVQRHKAPVAHKKPGQRH
jgi:hypothetical protein